MILAIGHKSGVGKDTFAMFLTDYLRSQNMRGLCIMREGFADRLYDLCYSFYNWAGFQTRQHYMMHPSEKNVVLPKIGKTPRQMLIDISHKLNEYDPDMFLNAVTQTKNCHLKIIPDLRRPWEFNKCIGTQGAFLLKITNPRIKTTFEMDHDLDPENRWHAEIMNDGDLECFRQRVIGFAEEHVVPKLYEALNRPLGSVGLFNASK